MENYLAPSPHTAVAVNVSSSIFFSGDGDQETYHYRLYRQPISLPPPAAWRR